MSATKPPGRSGREPVYAAAIGVGRAYFGGLLRLQPVVSGVEHVPATGGAILAITHFGYMDFALTEWIVWLRTRRHIRFLAKKGAFAKPVIGWLLRRMHHISVDMTAGAEAYDRAIAALRSGEVIGVFPEAGVSASFTVRELKTGTVRLAAEAGVPIIPVAVWGGQLLRTKNHSARLSEAYRAPIAVTFGAPQEIGDAEDPLAATARLRESLQSLVDGLQSSYPLDGTGQWWQPAHLGGAAPTPDVAAVAEAERKRRAAN
jgi:1-acyl-sn-glycerol-3-phosphate acyltransferase